MTTLSNSRVLPPGELAERLGISRVTLWRWERKGLLPPKRQVGPNVVGWLESEIDEWFARTSSAEPPTDGAPGRAKNATHQVPATVPDPCR